MKVGKLKEILKNIPDDFEVILSSDSEGNNYPPFRTWDIVMYLPTNSYSGSIVGELDYEDYPEDYEDIEFKLNAFCLWPTN